MRTSLFVGLVVLGVAGGFGAVAGLLSVGRVDQSPLDITASLQADKAWIANLGKGWGYTSRRGTVLEAAVATLDLPLGSVDGVDTVLDITALPNSDGAGSHLSVKANGFDVGAWKVQAPSSKRLVLPAVALQGQRQLRIEFTASKPGSLLIRELRLRDTRLLTDFAGHIDTCQGGEVSGWARAGLHPSPVTVRRGGKPALTFIPNTHRPDLSRISATGDIGFKVQLQPPVQRGESVELYFPDGRPLKGATCKP